MSPEEAAERQQNNESRTSTLPGFFRLIKRINTYLAYHNDSSDVDPEIAAAYDADNLKDLFKYLSNISDLNSKILYKEAIKDFRWDLNKNEWVARLMQ